MDESMAQVGCIPPYIPLNISEDYPVCLNETSGLVAYRIYEKMTNEERFDKKSKVWSTSLKKLFFLLSSFRLKDPVQSWSLSRNCRTLITREQWIILS